MIWRSRMAAPFSWRRAAVASGTVSNWTKAKRACRSRRTMRPKGEKRSRRSRRDVWEGSKLTTKRVSEGWMALRRRSSSRRLIIPSPRAHSTLRGRGAEHSVSERPSRAWMASRPFCSVSMNTKAKERLRSTRFTRPKGEKRRSRSEVRMLGEKLPTKMARGRLRSSSGPVAGGGGWWDG